MKQSFATLFVCGLLVISFLVGRFSVDQPKPTEAVTLEQLRAELDDRTRKQNAAAWLRVKRAVDMLDDRIQERGL